MQSPRASVIRTRIPDAGTRSESHTLPTPRVRLTGASPAASARKHAGALVGRRMADSAGHVPVLSSAFAWMFCGAEDSGSFVCPHRATPYSRLRHMGTSAVALLTGACFLLRLSRRLVSEPTPLGISNRCCGYTCCVQRVGGEQKKLMLKNHARFFFFDRDCRCFENHARSSDNVATPAIVPVLHDQFLRALGRVSRNSCPLVVALQPQWQLSLETCHYEWDVSKKQH